MDQQVNTTTTTGNPNPAATSTRLSSVEFNLNYITSPSGLLKIAEFVFGLICWALVAAVPLITFFSAYQFVLFVTITSWILTLITLIIYAFSIHSNACSGAPWSIIEFGNNALWALMYFIAACVAAAYAGNVSNLIAATVFAFLVAILYCVHTVVSFKEWRGSFPWQ